VTHLINRRRVLRGALLAPVASLLCRTAAADEWGYHGAHAPKLGQAEPRFQDVLDGTMQAPTRPQGAPSSARPTASSATTRPMPLKLINNATRSRSTPHRAAPARSTASASSSCSPLHHPSEHLLAGTAKQLEYISCTPTRPSSSPCSACSWAGRAGAGGVGADLGRGARQRRARARGRRRHDRAEQLFRRARATSATRLAHHDAVLGGRDLGGLCRARQCLPRAGPVVRPGCSPTTPGRSRS